jgi:putative transcriptional regulator
MRGRVVDVAACYERGMDLSDGKLAPGLLLAPPPLEDSTFDRTVVLLASHDDTGSIGFIINKKSPLQLHELLKELDIAVEIPDRRVLVGGPVQGHVGYVLYEHAPFAPLAPGIDVTPTISLSPSRDVLVAGAAGKLPGRFDLLLGHAGWDSNQLRGEFNRGSWLHAPLESALLFDVDVEERWTDAYARIGIAPWELISVKGGAQA